MKITIENNELVYIYLLEIEQRVGVVDETIPYVMGELLYDNQNNWMGIRLKDQFDEFSKYEVIDEYNDKIKILIREHEIDMFFRQDGITVFKSTEQDFNIDIVGKKIYGIEIIVSDENSIEKRSIPDFMIEYSS